MLSDGEKAIFAAAFVAEVERLKAHTPREVLVPGKEAEWGAVEREQASHAVEYAMAMVSRLHDAAAEIIAGYGCKSEEYQAYESMRGKKWR